MIIRQSKRGNLVAQSEIRSMTRECLRINGINMAQGLCDLEVPSCVTGGAKEAIDTGINTYTACQGMAELRQAVAGKMKTQYAMDVDPEEEVLISNGATGAFYATGLATLDPGDEVIVPEPYYGYHVATLKALDCIPSFLPLNPPAWSLDREALENVITKRTRALVLNTPSNPSGKVYSLSELEMVAAFAEAHDLIVFTDEIYEHFVYDEHTHIPPTTIPGMRKRTITISGLSKVFSITGWRVGYAVCPPQICRTASHFNDLVYVCAPSPLQIGAAKGLSELDTDYYTAVAQAHQEKRDRFCSVLTDVGLTPFIPLGAYYVLVDISQVPGKNDKERVMHILRETGVASVPGRAFYHDDAGANVARFCFSLKDELLNEACNRIKNFHCRA